MIRKLFAFFTFSSLMFFGILTTAQESGLDILTIGPGTKALGLNEAVTAELLGPSSLYSNPANLAMEQSSSLNADYTLWIGDLTHTHAGVNLRRNDRALAFGFLSSQANNSSLRSNTSSANGLFDINSISISGGYAYRLGKISLGAAIQYLREEYNIYNASGYAASLGAAGQFWDGRLRVGASLLSLGEMNKLRNQSTELPTTFKTGFTADLFTFVPPKNPELPIAVSIKNDVVFSIEHPVTTTQENQSKQPYTNIALEFTVAEMIALLTGYKTGDTVRPWSAGFGIDADLISAHYAIIPFETGFGTVHSLGLNYQF